MIDPSPFTPYAAENAPGDNAGNCVMPVPLVQRKPAQNPPKKFRLSPTMTDPSPLIACAYESTPPGSTPRSCISSASQRNAWSSPPIAPLYPTTTAPSLLVEYPNE